MYFTVHAITENDADYEYAMAVLQQQQQQRQLARKILFFENFKLIHTSKGSRLKFFDMVKLQFKRTSNSMNIC